MAAPAGNMFAVGNLGGRPPFFTTPEDMWNKAMEYFAICTNKAGKINATISGLSFYLGFESRQSFYDYELKEEFTYTVRRLRLAVEACYEANLYTFNTIGAIFALKNMGWKDKTETDITTGGRMLGKQVDLTDLTDEELAVLERLKSR